jgi:hypothetical protein
MDFQSIALPTELPDPIVDITLRVMCPSPSFRTANLKLETWNLKLLPAPQTSDAKTPKKSCQFGRQLVASRNSLQISTQTGNPLHNSFPDTPSLCLSVPLCLCDSVLNQKPPPCEKDSLHRLPVRALSNSRTLSPSHFLPVHPYQLLHHPLRLARHPAHPLQPERFHQPRRICSLFPNRTE